MLTRFSVACLVCEAYKHPRRLLSSGILRTCQEFNMWSEKSSTQELAGAPAPSSRIIFYFQLLFLGIAVHLVTLSIYRLYFHPLAKFPGPKLAALTLWYEFYYEVTLRGQFLWEIERMHEKHGPIVRINPHELHVNDPEFYDVIYAGGLNHRRHKYDWSARMFSNPLSMLSTVPHELHRLRRGALAQFFSKASVTRLEPIIKSKIEELSARFEQFRGTKEPVDLDNAFTAMTTDLITQYAFGKSFGYVHDANFAPQWKEMFVPTNEFSLLFKQFPIMQTVGEMMPGWMLKAIGLNVMHLVQFRAGIEKQIEAIMTGKNTAHENVEHRTMFHEILNSSLPAVEKTQGRLIDEAQTIVAAGTFTTAHFLKSATYYLLENPKVLETLRAELDKAAATCGWENPWDPIPPAREFESLPYLNMVHYEVLRLTYGPVGRLTRIAPSEELFLTDKETGKQWEIKRGTPISMNAYLQHRNKDLFPDPDKFDPERFRSSVEGDDNLDKYLVNFSKGTRICLGLNLAKAEIFLTLPVLVRRFLNNKEQAQDTKLMNTELFETDISDIVVAHDFFNPFPKLDTKGTRVLFT